MKKIISPFIFSDENNGGELPEQPEDSNQQPLSLAQLLVLGCLGVFIVGLVIATVVVIAGGATTN